MGRFRPESSFPSSNTNLEFQLFTSSSTPMSTSFPTNQENNNQDYTPELQLSIGSSYFAERNQLDDDHEHNFLTRNVSNKCRISNHEKGSNFALASRVKEQADEQLKLAMAEKAYAEEARRQAKWQMELAEEELENAKRIRQHAQEELERAQALREHAIKKVSSNYLQITCYSCKQRFKAAAVNNNTSTSSIQENED